MNQRAHESMRIDFSKYEGLGNDFVLIFVEDDHLLSSQQVIRLCDRHLGIGADGVLSVRKKGEGHEMVVQNSDGSLSSMCGNGLRCVMRFLVDEKKIDSATAHILYAGEQRCKTRVLLGGDIQVDMGRGLREHPDLSASPSLESLGRVFEGEGVYFGNPHYVTFVDDAPMLLAEEHGPVLERHPAFRSRANISFVRQALGQSFEAVVWERACGITQACGSGACAVATAAVLSGRAEHGKVIGVKLPGGELQITVHEDWRIDMCGPAAKVFSGSFEF